MSLLGDLCSTHSTLLTLRLLDACDVDCDQRSRMRRSHYKAYKSRTRSIKATTLDTRIRTTVTPALPLTKKGAPAITHKQHQHRQAYYLPPPLLLISATLKEKRKGRKISHFIIDANSIRTRKAPSISTRPNNPSINQNYSTQKKKDFVMADFAKKSEVTIETMVSFHCGTLFVAHPPLHTTGSTCNSYGRAEGAALPPLPASDPL